MGLDFTWFYLPFFSSEIEFMGLSGSMSDERERGDFAGLIIFVVCVVMILLSTFIVILIVMGREEDKGGEIEIVDYHT